MAQNTTVSLTLQIKGNAGAELKKISDQQVQSTAKLNQQWTQVAGAQAKFVNTAKAGTQATINTARAGDQLLRTNRMLEGVLRQQSIQTKLQSQLLKQQASSAQQMASWMKQVEQSSKRTQQNSKQTASLWQKGGAVVGGVTGGYMAAKAVAATPLERGRNFSAGIFDATASITNGFSGMSNSQSKAENQKLMQYAKDAVRKGHGTVEGVSDAAGILAASGIYENVGELKDPLQAVAKSSFASGANEADMARLAQQSKQFGIAPNRTQVAFDRMIGSGQAGGFELKDMAQFLPAVLASANRAGYHDEKGLNTVTTHLQLARKYTGTPGEAATNIDDLYGLVNQKHFKDAIAKNIKVEAGDPTKAGKKGKKVFDLTKYLANQQLQGVDTATSIAMLMNRQLSKNKDYNHLNAQLSQAVRNKNQEQAARIRQAIELTIAGQFGDIFHNKQSLSGISAIVNGIKSGDFKEIYDKSWNKEGATEDLAQRKGNEEFAQSSALEQEKILAQIQIYDGVNGKLGEFERWLTSIMQHNPTAAASALAGGGALSVATGAVGGGVLGGILWCNKGNIAKTAGGVLGRTSVVARAATNPYVLGAIGAGGVGYGIGTATRNMYMKTETGRKFDDKMGEAIAKTLAFFGNEDAKAAVEAQAKYDQMIAEQQNQTQVLASKLDGGFQMLASTFVNNKPVINLPSGGFQMQSTSKEEKRHGAAMPWSIAAK